jgi:hypothetical protein
MGAFTDHILCIKPLSSKECPGPLWMHIIGDGTWAILVALKYPISQQIIEDESYAKLNVWFQMKEFNQHFHYRIHKL